MATGFSVPTVTAPRYTEDALLTAIMMGDIYYIATHGEYDLTKEQTPFEVPANTFIFETQALGDLCMSPIDKPLWTFAQAEHREAFLYYLMNISSMGINPSAVSAFKDALSSLILYGPGDKVPVRNLFIAGGESTPRSMPMGIYKLEPNKDSILFPPGGKGKSLAYIENPLWETGKSTTNANILSDVPQSARPRIFFFISCATHSPIDKYDIDKMRIWNTIASLQEAAKHQALAVGITTLAGGSTAPSRTLPSVHTPIVEDDGAGSAMRTGGVETNLALRRMMKIRHTVAPCNGFAAYINEGHTVKPVLTKDGRACLTEAEARQLREEFEKTKPYGIELSILQYTQTGAGRRRRTLRNRKRRLNKSKRNRGNARV